MSDYEALEADWQRLDGAHRLAIIMDSEYVKDLEADNDRLRGVVARVTALCETWEGSSARWLAEAILAAAAEGDE